MAFSAQFLDELRARAGLADVIRRRVKLAKKGREYLGLCPFHKEKTPSFTVNEDKGFYHCFGCGAHGGVIDFVMQAEGLSFPEAVERLAAEAGLAIPSDTPEHREKERRRQSLYDVMEKACRFFEKSLRMPAGKGALAYLRGRGLDDATIARFRLGFAPRSRGALKAALARDGVEAGLLVAAGLVIVPEDETRSAYDRFRGRIMFPVSDRRGRVIAFGGRTVPGAESRQGNEPKYLNSPETALFHKGRVLYNLAAAAAEARRSATLVVTEGYMDVIALDRAGLRAVVAPLGTALTEGQIAELWRVAREPVLCFDGDQAGRRAAARAAERVLPLLRPGYGLRFAALPEGEDPDSLVKRRGADAMARVLAAARPLSEVLWAAEGGGRALRTPEDRAYLQKRLRDYAAQITDPTVRSHFLQAFNERIWAKRGGRDQGRRDQGRRDQGRSEASAAPLRAGAGRGVRIDASRRREQVLLAVVLKHPEFFEQVGERLGTLEMSAGVHETLRQALTSMVSACPGLGAADLEGRLRAQGLGDAIDEILRVDIVRSLLRPSGPLGPDASPEDIGAVWQEFLDLKARRFLDDDISSQMADAGSTLSDGALEEKWKKARSLLQAKLENSD